MEVLRRRHGWRLGLVPLLIRCVDHDAKRLLMRLFRNGTAAHIMPIEISAALFGVYL